MTAPRTSRSSRPSRTVAGAVLAAVAVVGIAGCSSAGTSTPATTSAAPAPSASPAPGAPSDAIRQALGQANQGALALVALGGLGTDKGVGDQVKGLAPELTQQGQALVGQVKQSATGASVTLGDQLDAQHQALVADLQARSGQPFDAAWLQAAQTTLQQARDAQNAILADPNASASAKAAAQQALAQLGALAAKLSAAASSAGAATPGSVAAGTGGQAAAADDTLPLVLGGAGVVLLGAAGIAGARRRSRV